MTIGCDLNSAVQMQVIRRNTMIMARVNREEGVKRTGSECGIVDLP